MASSHHYLNYCFTSLAYSVSRQHAFICALMLKETISALRAVRVTITLASDAKRHLHTTQLYPKHESALITQN